MAGTSPAMTAITFSGPSSRGANSLLPVIDQDLVAALADARAMLFQAGQHGRVAVIHDRTAVTRHVAGTGVVLALLDLRGGHGSEDRRRKDNKRNERREQNRPDHHFSPQSASPNGNQVPACNAVNAFRRQPEAVDATKIHRTEPDRVGTTLTSISH
jgi:hypothetical protein